MHNLFDLIEQKKYSEVRDAMNEINEVDLAELLSESDDPRVFVLFRLMSKDKAAEVFAYLDQDTKQRIIESITDRELSYILEELFLDDAVDMIEEMPSSMVKRILQIARPETRRQINQLLKYPESSAGSIMTTEYMEINGQKTVAETLGEIRKTILDKELVTEMFVTDEKHHLEGTVSLRQILAAKDDEKTIDLAEKDPISAKTLDDQADVAESFKKYDLLSMPVTDNENRLVGMITIDDVVDVIEEENTEDIYKMAAMAPIEKSYMDTGVWSLVKKRIVWLSILMISATFTGMIITRFESALATQVLLASFIPMLMDTSGNAGAQASVAVIRAMALNEMDFSDFFKVVFKEFRVSIICGLCMGILNFLRVYIFYHDLTVAIVVGATLVCSIICAKLVGASLPMLAQKLKLDPALMASPMITTIVDAVCLLLYFRIAVSVLTI